MLCVYKFSMFFLFIRILQIQNVEALNPALAREHRKHPRRPSKLFSPSTDNGVLAPPEAPASSSSSREKPTEAQPESGATKPNTESERKLLPA